MRPLSLPLFSRVASSLLALVTLSSACGTHERAEASTTGQPELRKIAGGMFEASGVAHVPASNTVLFVDDGRNQDIFLMELTPQGTQHGTTIRVPLGADVTDMEGITSDSTHFYVVGSQSKGQGFDGDGLVRFIFNPATRRAEQVQRIGALKAWLAENVPELRGTAQRTGDDVLNIEGLAWDPQRERLLLGLRAPVVDGHALVIPIKLAEASAGFTRENLRLDGGAIRLPLGGAGIRGLDYDPHTRAFRLISGAALNAESADFRVMEWSGDAAAPLNTLASYSCRLKPEGITRATIDGRSVSVIVFDTGRFLVAD